MKIDKKIPIQKGYCLYESKYPFKKMKIGDSFLATKAIKISSLRTSAAQFGKRHNIKFLTRKVEGGLRIWRIK